MLVDSEILKAIKKKQIIIDPFIPEHLGPNSYDVTLNDTLVVYESEPLDMLKENDTSTISIPGTGMTLVPGEVSMIGIRII